MDALVQCIRSSNGSNGNNGRLTCNQKLVETSLIYRT